MLCELLTGEKNGRPHRGETALISVSNFLVSSFAASGSRTTSYTPIVVAASPFRLRAGTAVVRASVSSPPWSTARATRSTAVV